MDSKPRCQSCGMPLGTAGYYGTNKDGSENLEYCKFCYANGAYTNAAMTLPEMIESSVQFMTSNLKFEETKARELSEKTISDLKRWKK